MKKYLSVFRMRFINALQYRASAFSGVANQLAWGSMGILAFAAFYRANPAAFPMTFPQTASYIWLGEAFIALFMMGSWEMDICSSIESGSIAYELVRPMALYDRWFSQIAANRLARTALNSAPVILVALIVPEPYRLMLPPDGAHFILFALSAVLALCVVAAFSMLMYISVFYTMTARGLRIIFTAVCDFLAGATIPLPFFPTPVRNIVELLPFASMQNMPLRIYIGDIAGPDALRGIALQMFWLVLLIAVGRAYMRRALGKVSVQGG